MLARCDPLCWRQPTGGIDGASEARIGKNGPEVTAIGLGCMSLSGIYGTSDDEAGVGLIHQAVDLGVDHSRQLRHVWLGPERGTARPGTEGAARQGRARHQIRPDAAAGRRQRRRRPPGICAAGLRGEPEAARRRCDRPLLPAPGRSRRCRSRTRSARWRGSSSRARCAISACARRGRSASARRTSVHPIAAVQSEFSLLYREEATETRAVTRDLGISFVAYAPLGRSLLDRRRPRSRQSGRGRHARPPPALRRATISRKNRVLVERHRGDRRRQALHRRRSSASPGCWRRATT